MQPKHSQAMILLVDDDRLMRDMLTATLEDVGAEVATANHSEDAKLSLAVCRPDLILCDAVMPVLDGFGLCRQLKDDPNYKDIPFAILSSLSRNVGERSTEAGADDYFSKSGSDVLLRMRVRTLLDISLMGDRRIDPAEVFVGARALLVTPSAPLRTQFSVQLAPTGLQLEECSGATELFKRLTGPQPDLLILDAKQEDGLLLDLAAVVRNEDIWPTVPILVLADKGEESALESLESLVSDWIHKPLDGRELRRRAQLLLRSTRAAVK
jgi:two-component system, cell cycle response regulator